MTCQKMKYLFIYLNILQKNTNVCRKLELI
jgi:hypothetical protein